jgi:Flp pilus assembly protein TadG
MPSGRMPSGSMLGRSIGRRASSAIEFAVVAPIMLLMAAGLFEVGSLLQADAAVDRLAMQYAISYAECSDTSSGVCLTELNQYTTSTAIAYIAPQIPIGALTVSMAQAKMTSGMPSVEYIYPSGGALSAAQISALQAVVGNGQTGVVVTITYPYKLQMFSLLMAPIIGSSFTLSYTVAQLK